MDDVVTEFEAERARLLGLAYRMLGSVHDAEDVAQEVWLRLADQDRAEIRNLPAWLTTVASRLCLDRLRAAQTRREQYVGPWLPEPVVSQVPGPAELAEVDESMRLALLTVLAHLNPGQRVAFVLHDVFDVPFDQVASVLDTSEANARQLASRARRAVQQGAPPPAVPRDQQRAVVDAFLRAVAAGDLGEVVSALAPGVVLTSDGGGRVSAALRPVLGADKVARFFLGLWQMAHDAEVDLETVLVNGEVGVVVRIRPHPGSRIEAGATVVLPRVGPDGLVHGIDVVRNPEKLAGLGAARR
ncbi:RNA polymerase sigma factor SigJ [Actinotalea sp. BY-33]|uniref:RNA polymerase sigma factor SigJ n=1 Tax=Actinotalea soli TaxID=2819234 RepID=A0A939RWP6_9CELL|nr:RNA polymerase sigma factor SigJ [Actinotalea soli]MBO1752843.1 RNA polymerase sigma factor SigJ [Actinotalea soli]